ncbi:MAG: hypothetical protein ACI8PD_002218 [Nitrospinales bacterium]|jgi:hypothetical protein
MGIKFWFASGILGVASAFILKIIEYNGGSAIYIRIADNGELATLGLVFIASIALRIIRKALK